MIREGNVSKIQTEKCYKNKKVDHHAANSIEKYNAVTVRIDEKEMSFKKLEIFFKVVGYEEGFASISRGTLGISMYIETSYTNLCDHWNKFESLGLGWFGFEGVSFFNF